MTTPQDSPSLTIRLCDGIEMSFRWIEPGEFRMGARGEIPDEEPVHRVRITRPFYLGIVPVTQSQFGVWTKSAGIEHNNHFADKGNHPAENLDWHQATDFCEWLNQSYGSQVLGFQATLPTEAQWEYACRAGTETEYNTCDGLAALQKAGWFGEEWGSGSTHPVGQKEPNRWGLYDMHGNVWEWCRDVWDEFAYHRRADGIADPEVTLSDVSSKNPVRVLRGGSWVNSAWDCRSAIRYGRRPDYRFGVVGFRVCLVPGPVPVEKRSRE